MKKRCEMDLLEDQVRLLSEQKAAIEASNEELKRQNKYWEELFAKQQLLPQNSQQQPELSQLSNHGSAHMAKVNSMPEQQQEFGSSHSHEITYAEEGQLSDPSYENLEMTRAEFMKRQKFANDGQYGNTSQTTPKGMPDNLPLMRNISFGGQMRQLSEGRPGNQEEQKDLLAETEFNVDDVLIDRSAGGRGFSNTTFFGLAMVFGAVGTVSFMSASPMEGTPGPSVYSGSRLAGTERLPTGESSSITNPSEETVYIEQQSPYQNMMVAFQLIMQAFLTMPAMAYISFAFSLVFMVLWLSSFSYMR